MDPEAKLIVLIPVEHIPNGLGSTLGKWNILIPIDILEPLLGILRQVQGDEI